MAFSFGFSGDDIEADAAADVPRAIGHPVPETPSATSAFPVPGKPQLPPTQHKINHLLSRLPSKIAYDCLDVRLDDGSLVSLPRRELWDVRMQLMAEDGDSQPDTDAAAGQGTTGAGAGADAGGLGNYDVKTGVYEGGFKSWESSVDLVKTLAAEHILSVDDKPHLRVIELGCGTALPSVAMLQWLMATDLPSRRSCSFILADYNPSVLTLVTLPNLLLAWAIHHQNTAALQDAFSMQGELELSPGVLDAFQRFLLDASISISFISGAWSREFVELLYDPTLDTLSAARPLATLVLGAETIYSPFALQAFTQTIFAILEREQRDPVNVAKVFVGAKRLYFGVGGSLDDFIERVEAKGGIIARLREETDGVRRGVVRCTIAQAL